jgi:asparagine synthase (glutamine-hydrolysing)
MCGIAGIFERNGQPIERETLERMTAALVHRGPDSDGYFIDSCAGICMRRLEVIDLSTGDQPIATADGRLQIVFNGEIYNYRELRDELRDRGCTFATESDTEVLLQMYREHGLAMLERLNGMFAFAIWDCDAQQLVIGRDRAGIKPLYYADSAARLVFASEIGALVASRLVAREVDPGLIPALFTLQYVPGPRTLFKGILKLEPGACLRITRTGTELIPAPQPVPQEPPGDERELVSELRTTLASAVRYRMIADVPLGALLSGGLDSSIVVGLMARESSRPVQTFSVGFESRGSFDELAHARRIAQHFDTDHHELVFTAGDLRDRLAETLAHIDDPIIDPATLPTLLISRLARQHVTVALTGEGADELFGGYRRYLYQHALGRLPRSLLRLVPGSLGGHRVRQALGALAETDPLSNHLAWSQVIADTIARRLLDADALQQSRQYVRSRLATRLPDGADPVISAMLVDQRFWLVDDLLTKVDRMSMACSLEARVPYLDHRVVALANRIPLRYKLHRLTGKQILREAFADLVPGATRKRRKQGFDLPLSEWFRTSLRSFVLDHLALLRDDPVIHYATVERIVADHMQGRDDYPVLLFGLLVYSAMKAAG